MIRMKGKLDIKDFEYIDTIIDDRFYKHTLELKLKEELPKVMQDFAESSFHSGFLDCIHWLREKKIIKVKMGEK